MPIKCKPDKTVDLALRAYPDQETMLWQIKEPDDDFGDTLAQFLVKELSGHGTDAAEAQRRLDRAIADIGAVRERLLELAPPWTAVLRYPDFMVDDYGWETTVRHVCAEGPAEAVAEARRQVAEEYPDSLSDEPEAMFLVAVFPGHHKDLSDGEGGVEE